MGNTPDRLSFSISRTRLIRATILLLVIATGVGGFFVGRETAPSSNHGPSSAALTTPATSYTVESGSMEPTLRIGDTVAVGIAFDANALIRGQIIIYKKPPNDFSPGTTDLVSRIIGLPGETISASGGRVDVNGQPITEGWLPSGETTGDFPPTDVPEGDYFVMGDNRGDSADSRIVGPISGSLVVGPALTIVAPPNRVRTLTP